VAKKPSKVEQFQAELTKLSETIGDDLHLPSLKENRLEGFAASFVIVLPLMNNQGQPVFTGAHLDALFRIVDNRFGGCMVPSSSSHPPYWGIWHPSGGQVVEAEMDYVTTIQILANPIEPTNRFFSRLKQILKTAGNIEQQEILVSRIDCWLM
jgi:hypothetical protein